MSIARIHKGIINKFINKLFIFLWSRKRAKEGIPLVKWSRIATLKELGGWSLKNTYLFNLALVARSL